MDAGAKRERIVAQHTHRSARPKALSIVWCEPSKKCAVVA
jgi:hypothetical protein